MSASGPDPAAGSAPRRRLYRDPHLLAIFSVTLIAVLGVASIAPALPTISRRFGIGSGEVAWLVSIFTIPGIVLTPLMGLASDRIGRKRVLLPSLILFAVAGGACTLVDDFGSLVMLRFLQGVGAAALGAVNFALISDLYSGHDRITAFGYNTAVISAGAAGYPLIGGAVVILGWHYPFFLPLLALPVALIVWRVLPNPKPDRSSTMGRYLRDLARVVGVLDVGALFLASLTVFIVLYGALITYLPFFMEQRLAATSLDYGLVMASHAAASTLAAVKLGDLSRRYAPRRLALTALAIMAPATIAVAFIPSLWVMFILAAVHGSTVGLSLSLFQTLLAELAPVEQRGAVLALNGTMIRLGQTLGPPLMAVFLAVGGMPAVFVGGGLVIGLVLPLLVLAMRVAAARQT